MAKVVGVHRFALKPEVKGADFEEFMRTKVFPGLGVVPHVDKTISHEFTITNWLHTEHLLLRSNQDGNYLWMITADVADDKVSTEEARKAVGQEAQRIVEEFFELGSGENTIAAVKLRPFATRTSLATFLEMGHFKFEN
jgi:hypothetical protein